MISRAVDVTISQSNVMSQVEQFLMATTTLNDGEDFEVETITYNPKTKEFRIKGVATQQVLLN